MPKVRSNGPKLVNRGGAGLLAKAGGPAGSQPPPAEWAVDKIAPALAGQAVEISSLVPDPMNARLHPDRNLDAIKLSLHTFGQVKPIVVRWQTNVVMAGNGTMRAAREMGWTRIAAVFVEMTDAEAAAYGLADNRTAELAAWDFKVVEALDKLAAEAALPTVGWTLEELAVLRKQLAPPDAPAEFPEVDENIETEHVCPRCGYAFSGGEVQTTGGSGAESGTDGRDEAGMLRVEVERLQEMVDGMAERIASQSDQLAKVTAKVAKHGWSMG